ncbi:MAG: sigma-54-dependent transcriptional regulator [Thermoanaerobaculia bacterium]
MSPADAPHATVLVVDDEASIRESLRMVLEYEGYRVEEAASGREALAKAASLDPAAVLLDIKMPEMDGLEVLGGFRERGYAMPVLVITGHGDIATAVEATRKGAFDFFEKPLQRERILLSLRNAVENHRLRQEGEAARQEPDQLIGSSAAMRRLRDTIERAAPTPATVLIVGESGTGKELIARAIHAGSARRDRPFVQVNCAAIPEELIESELFGHEKGSFTGATRRQIGKFVAADNGTIFLDEVGDMSARTQAKVLRVLEGGEVEPVGAARVERVDVRVVAATNRNLEEEIAAGRFREDLYFRLNVIPIRSPDLRQRSEDIPELVDYFTRRFSRVNNYRPKKFSDEAVGALKAMPWRGNVRELKNFVERLMILVPGDEIGRDVLEAFGGGLEGEAAAGLFDVATLKEFREVSERAFILRKLEEHEWNITRTAEAMDTPRSNLYKKLDQYEIARPEEAS